MKKQVGEAAVEYGRVFGVERVGHEARQCGLKVAGRLVYKNRVPATQACIAGGCSCASATCTRADQHVHHNGRPAVSTHANFRARLPEDGSFAHCPGRYRPRGDDMVSGRMKTIEGKDIACPRSTLSEGSENGVAGMVSAYPGDYETTTEVYSMQNLSPSDHPWVAAASASIRAPCGGHRLSACHIPLQQKMPGFRRRCERLGLVVRPVF